MSSTTPDTLTPQELAAIRKRDADLEPFDPMDEDVFTDRRAILAHIDALTAAVEGQTDLCACCDTRDVVLAILRGEQ